MNIVWDARYLGFNICFGNFQAYLYHLIGKTGPILTPTVYFHVLAVLFLMQLRVCYDVQRLGKHILMILVNMRYRLKLSSICPNFPVGVFVNIPKLEFLVHVFAHMYILLADTSKLLYCRIGNVHLYYLFSCSLI